MHLTDPICSCFLYVVVAVPNRVSTRYFLLNIITVITVYYGLVYLLLINIAKLFYDHMENQRE